MLPPRHLTRCILFAPTLVLAAGRPSSNFLFFLSGFLLPPVFRRLCQLSREIPMMAV